MEQLRRGGSWIVEAATAYGSSVKETARGEGEDGPL